MTQDNVLVLAEDIADMAELKALRFLLQEAEPASFFDAPQAINALINLNDFGRLRILKGDEVCEVTQRAIDFFKLQGLPIAYHTITLTTTAG